MYVYKSVFLVYFSASFSHHLYNWKDVLLLCLYGCEVKIKDLIDFTVIAHKIQKFVKKEGNLLLSAGRLSPPSHSHLFALRVLGHGYLVCVRTRPWLLRHLFVHLSRVPCAIQLCSAPCMPSHIVFHPYLLLYPPPRPFLSDVVFAYGLIVCLIFCASILIYVANALGRLPINCYTDG